MVPAFRRFLCVAVLWLAGAAGAPGDEGAAAELFAGLRGSAQREAFLRAFPKGGDLHTHLGGAIPPEKLIAIAARLGFCLEARLLLLMQNLEGACPAGQTPATEIRPDSEVYQRLLEVMSMRGNRGGPQNGHAHFFQAFRFRFPVPGPVLPELLEEVVVRAASQNISYLELMIFPFNIRLRAEVAGVLPPEGSLEEWLAALEKSEAFGRYVRDGAKAVADAEKQLMARRPAEAGAVQRRYQVNVGRIREPANVFVQLAATAALAALEPRVVGVNLAAPEDDLVARRDFRLHMRMLDFLVSRRPYLRVSLHAGELVPRLLGPSAGADLTFHIGESVWQGRAERIGHGSSLRYERDRENLLRAMRERGVLVEICLTSEAVILGLEGKDDPILDYRAAGVPVSLNTDDEGILETDLTREFLRAARDYGLDYRALKELARNSIEYSFLPGAGLFRTRDYREWVPACASSPPPAAASWTTFREQLPPACLEYLSNNPKAETQLRLEHQFSQFEAPASLARFAPR